MNYSLQYTMYISYKEGVSYESITRIYSSFIADLSDI